MFRLLRPRLRNRVLRRLPHWRCVLGSYIARSIVLAPTSALLAGIPVQILKVSTATSKSAPESTSRSTTIVLLWWWRLLLLHTRPGVLWRVILWWVVLALWRPLWAVWLRVALVVVWRILSLCLSVCCSSIIVNQNGLTVVEDTDVLEEDPILLCQPDRVIVVEIRGKMN